MASPRRIFTPQKNAEHVGSAGVGGNFPQHGSGALPQRVWVPGGLPGVASREGGSPQGEARHNVPQGQPSYWSRFLVCQYRVLKGAVLKAFAQALELWQ